MTKKPPTKEEAVDKAFRYGEKCGLEIALTLLNTTLAEIEKDVKAMEPGDQVLLLNKFSVSVVRKIINRTTALARLIELMEKSDGLRDDDKKGV